MVSKTIKIGKIMQKDDWASLSPGDLVICYEEDWDMPFGWDDEMCDMVDLELPVEQLVDNGGDEVGVILRNPDSGQTYSFHFNYVELVSKKLKMYRKAEEFTVGLFVYQQIRHFDYKSLGNIALPKDIETFKKHISTVKVKINDNVYHNIRAKCPRVIGVLLSNNILRKTKVLQ